MGGVGVDRLDNGDRPASLGGAARQSLRLVLGLPERQDAGAVGFLVVIGNGEALGPVAALTVGRAPVMAAVSR